ncbi:flap endonuclease-1 [Candidatus Alkanophaga liquidiphilum]|nr:5'-3' exonuclease Xni/ExoIX [Candidatus Alkanophaga liquidiphilum]RLG38553.1 MAG: flap endonuclease-1 [Candidatus Alkanophagales archaeon]
MGVDIGSLFVPKELSLGSLAGRVVAVDAYNTLYQFLSIIRQPDGTPLMDSKGRITSHLSGLIYRTSNLVESGIKLVFVFDGEPHRLKAETLQKRAAHREEARRLWEELKEVAPEEAFKYAQASAKVDEAIIRDAKTLLGYMGIPCVQAPSEGEAQAAHIVRRGDADYVASQDYDSLLFGAPLLVRNLSISRKRKLPSGRRVEISPELIELSQLEKLGITRVQLVDIAILIGTDFNDGIKGIGAKKALKLIKEHGSLEAALSAIGKEIEDYEEVRRIFLEPDVTDDYKLAWAVPDEDAIKRFLCDEHDFSEERVEKAIEKLKGGAAERSGAERRKRAKARGKMTAEVERGQTRIDQWF